MTQLEYVSVAEAPFTEIFSRYVEGVGCSAGGGAAWSSVEQREGGDVGKQCEFMAQVM